MSHWGSLSLFKCNGQSVSRKGQNLVLSLCRSFMNYCAGVMSRRRRGEVERWRGGVFSNEYMSLSSLLSKSERPHCITPQWKQDKTKTKQGHGAHIIMGDGAITIPCLGCEEQHEKHCLTTIFCTVSTKDSKSQKYKVSCLKYFQNQLTEHLVSN